MEKKSLAIAIRLMLNIACITCSMLLNAQSITGKWKLTDAKETVTDKSTGKTNDLGAQ